MKTDTSSLIARYIWLLNNIAEAGEAGLSRSEINRLWEHCIYNENHESEIPRKTFYNYKCEIESLFGITLEVVRLGGQFCYRIAQEESLQLGQVKQLLLNSLSINEAVMRGGDFSDRILLEDIPSSGGAVLGVIMQAIRTCKVLRIEHKSFKPGARARVSTVHPYCLKLREQRWYMLSYCVEADDSRLYGLDRIASCIPTGESYDAKALKDFFRKRKKVKTPDDYFRDYYGVIIDDRVPLMDIRIRVFGEQFINFFRSLPLHSSQVEVATVEGDGPYADFAYHIHPTADFTSKLLSYGASVKVLSPAKYVKEIAATISDSAANYNER